MKRNKKWLILALVCLIVFFWFCGPMEKMILKKTLPGEWTLLAGGGFETCVFDTDGTVTITESSGATPYEPSWHLEIANLEKRQRFWSHPNIILVVGDKEYGIGLGLEAVEIVDGRMVSSDSLELEFVLTFSCDGGGEYIRSH